MVGYKPSFKQNQKVVKKFTNKDNIEFVEDNEIHDETIKDPNSIKAGMTDSEMVEVMQKTIRTVTDMCQKYNGTGRIYQFASNIEHNMSMNCWHDKNPVHMLSSCDLTKINVVQRQPGQNKVTISCPLAVNSIFAGVVKNAKMAFLRRPIFDKMSFRLLFRKYLALIRIEKS